MKPSVPKLFKLCVSLFALMLCATAIAADKPNILVIWGDDVGIWNISDNSRGMMAYNTPNIDRIAEVGMVFSDY